MSDRFQQIQHAYTVQDPALIDKLLLLCYQPDPAPTTPIPDDELTFERFLAKIFSYEFRQKHPEVQFAERIAMIAKLETDEGVYPLPDRFRIHIILRSLWEDNSDYARAVLLSAIDRLPLSYGVWKGFKHIFKQAEAQHDYAMFARLAVRIDCERFDQSARTPVSSATKTYMSLRAWRFLRNIGEQSGFLYPEVTVQVLASYPENFDLNSPQRYQSWVLNHICFHNSTHYGVTRFASNHRRKLFDEKGRAFANTWQRDAEPLLRLMLTARNEAIRQFATDSLKHEFKNELRDVSVATIQQLSAISERSNAKDELIVWLISHSPNFEQSQFRTLGLHEVVLKLLFSNEAQASKYAFEYAKSYALDLPLATLLLLADSSNGDARQFAIGQILSRDARKDIGLAGWGQLLDSPYHHEVASKQLLANFNRRDFSQDWFVQRLLSQSGYSVDFAVKNLLNFYPADELGMAFFIDLTQRIDDNVIHASTMQLALDGLKQLCLAKVPVEVWQRLLLHPLSQATVKAWLNADLIHANTLPMDYWHALAFEADWHSSEWVKALTTPIDGQISNWQRYLTFDTYLAEQVMDWLSDVRRFVPVNIGFDWLMKLANSDNSDARQFAIDRINKGFLPADFVPQTSASQVSSQPATTDASQTEINVDLAEQSFLFTGKMQSMTRETAEDMVKKANGKILGAVNNKLDFLVIGDDGSPLYGNGRKGSKQVKAEELIAKGAGLKIISETAFLQMLSGQARQVDDDQTLAGAEALWHMAVSDANSPMSELATTYLLHHHTEICMALTDRPVDPDAVIPNSFFSAERVIPILNHGNARLRQFALQIATYEFANWQLTADQWVSIAESSHSDVQDFINKALLDKASAENRRYHVPADKLSANMLYALLDSQKRTARQLGVTLLMRNPQFHEPETLYRLTESTDREVRYASVKMLWQHYRKRHLPATWQPKPINAKLEKQDTAVIQNNPVQNRALEKDKTLPASLEQLLLLLKRGLFELPPARLGENTKPNEEAKPTHKAKFYNGQLQQPNEQTQPSKPISASRAKLALIETYRDVALGDVEFAKLVLPLLQQFTVSAGKMERHACLVAVTRIQAKFPEFAEAMTA
ncbi:MULTISPECIES: BRCT domain-containing protein [unclassified Moraxella]|uniref:BRCT domain-containing protein n=1 Tax=unclassified Moraxella TaxID=2685852 RepID=UPI003AF4C3FC